MHSFSFSKKLENDLENISFKVESRSHQSNIREPDSEAQSMLQPEVPPWAESYEISSTDADGMSLSTTSRSETYSHCLTCYPQIIWMKKSKKTNIVG